MSRKRIVGLEWLDPENVKQRNWAVEYLRSKGFGSLFHDRDKTLSLLLTHAEMQHIGSKIEQSTDARGLFRDMKDAWRQKRARDGDNGRQACVFTLKTTTKNHLKEMAKDRAVSVAELLEVIIEKAYKAKCHKEQKFGEKKQQGDRRHTQEHINALMAADNTPPENSETSSQIIPEASINTPYSLKPAQLHDDTAGSLDKEIVEPPQKPDSTAHGPQLELAAPEDLAKSSDDALHAQNDRRQPSVKVKYPKKKRRIILNHNSLIPEQWDTDQDSMILLDEPMPSPSS